MTDLLLAGVAAPLLIGIGLALTNAGAGILKVSSPAIITTCFAALALPLLYWLLEGLPPFPPIASKHKLGYVLAFAGLFAVGILSWSQSYRFLKTLIALSLAAIWIGIRKFTADDGLWQAFLLGMPVFVFATTAHLNAKQTENAYLWPVTLLIFAIATAFVCLTGGYIGMAQLSGAIAAFIGGWLLVRYISDLIGKSRLISTIPAAVHWLILFSLAVVFLSAVLFAPKLNTIAAIAALGVLFTPLYAQRLSNLSPRIQPVAIALCALVPGLIAVLTPFLSNG